ncbi:MAG TPA: hypothetical protein DEP42_00330 [Ruminococcaceae bacterium]|nr:hypothetical protein [Oscillospiraceae bacterium]
MIEHKPLTPTSRKTYRGRLPLLQPCPFFYKNNEKANMGKTRTTERIKSSYSGLSIFPILRQKNIRRVEPIMKVFSTHI